MKESGYYPAGAELDTSRAGLFTPAKDGETTAYVSLLMPMLIQND